MIFKAVHHDDITPPHRGPAYWSAVCAFGEGDTPAPGSSAERVRRDMPAIRNDLRAVHPGDRPLHCSPPSRPWAGTQRLFRCR
ncbi:hypothetical protein AQI88_38095 [Streptomyces cellostaticus]|uniref:Uncharacterized protein n=1 Tax=Streptomyces cellostaticus TaxID=67285 RepID=A0A101NDG8_9ACTN|nr:hypothetical protein [Streptomyces cellostaticus]KUM91228.1 hypothetical protein AQI88_38095 [Streptomyces cellostaticus]GHI03566.1 hypothetical protein Scel_18870 [Streptomyces cellostaticus]